MSRGVPAAATWLGSGLGLGVGVGLGLGLGLGSGVGVGVGVVQAVATDPAETRDAKLGPGSGSRG